jgi:ABC-2 type transport system permease protein
MSVGEANLTIRGAKTLMSTSPLDGARFTAPRKYLNICRVSLIERLAYRGDFFLATCLRFLPLLTTILLWNAIYAGAGKDEISGYTYRNMIAYLLLVHISRMFSSMPGLSTGIAREIRQGNLKKYLLQPIDMIAYLLAYRVAHKIAYIATSGVPYALLFIICSSFFTLPSPLTFLAYVAALLMGFLVGFFFECCMGMLGFWMLEVTSLLYVVNTINFFISGQMFPLDLLPPFWANLLKALPFQYLAYFPAAVFLGRIDGLDLVRGLLLQAFWSLAFILIARQLFRAGLRRYSAYGG